MQFTTAAEKRKYEQDKKDEETKRARAAWSLRSNRIKDLDPQYRTAAEDWFETHWG